MRPVRNSALAFLTAGFVLLMSVQAAFAEDPLVQAVQTVAPNMEPVIPHVLQSNEAREKLAALEKKFGKKPNILIFLMDDVGYGDPGCFGGGHMSGAATPNIDRLCKEGLMLTSCYAQPSCSPTRATIMTGRLPIRHGILRPPMYGEKGGLQGEITMAQLLNEAGYATQAVGKWHMGENVESQPQNVGFEDFFGFLSVSDMYTEWRDSYFYPEIVHNPARTAMVEAQKFNKHLVHAKKGGPIENLDEITIPVCSKLDEMWADYSLGFIRRAAADKRPFFLYHCTRGCHFDNYPNDKFKGKSACKYPYKDVIVEIDDVLGRLVKELETTGQLDNTLIFVTSDNGPEMEAWPDCGYSPFRGAKGSTWEGGMRVPGVAYWHGMINSGRVNDGLFDLSDLFTTSLAVAGASSKVPADRFIDGVDQTSYLLAHDGESNRKFVYYWLKTDLSALRCAEYKFFRMATDFDHKDTVCVGGFSGYNKEYTFGKFFNLYLDPTETHSYLIRKLVYTGLISEALNAHRETLKKYPPKIVVTVD